MSSPAISYANQASNLAKNPTLPLNPRAAAKKAEQAQAALVKQQQAKADAASAAVAAKKAAVAPPVVVAAPVTSPKVSDVAEEFTAVDLNRPAVVPAKPKGRATGFALVKAVLSGDTIVLMGNLNNAAEPEKIVSLSGVNAPKFARGKNQVDEPFAWESREFLRRLVLGQQVQFNINYVHENSGREYGTVTLNAQNLAHLVAKNGWAAVKGPATKDGKLPPEREELSQLAQAAEAKRLGIFSGATPAEHIRKINWSADARVLFEQNKNQPLKAVVDQVRDGSTLRVELTGLGKPLQHTVITLYLAGAVSPRTPVPQSVIDAQIAKGEQPQNNTPEPFSLEAQQFTENRLLNRDVQVVLQGIDKTGNLFGSVVFAKGNIVVKLLEGGFARFVSWSAALTGEDNEKQLRAAAEVAKNSRARLYASYTPPAAGSVEEQIESGHAEISGKVIQILSGDSVIVIDGKDQERRFMLASIRAPKLGVKGAKDEAYAQEAKEQLRQKLIGHKVRIIQEYTRPAPPQSSDTSARVYATLLQGKVNVNEALVSLGLAEVIKHRIDEQRSQFYVDYVTAENAAAKQLRGIHNPKEVVVPRIVDLTERSRAPAASADGTAAASRDDTKSKQLSAKAKQYIVFLQREQQVNAVVEYVFSGARLKLFVPKEHILISFALGGIKVASTRKDAEGKVDPIGEAAAALVKSKLQQHSVRIEVDTLDKADNFIGSLFYGKVNLAVELLELGYAQTFGFSAERNAYKDDLFAAEARAKEAKLGLWLNWVEPVKVERVDGESTKVQEFKEGQDLVNVKVTEIEDCTDFFVQFVGDRGLELVDAALAKVAEEGTPYDINSGAYVAAGQFTDDSWYRVRIESETEEGNYRVFFIDYGNFDELDPSKLRTLPTEIARIAPLAHHACLAGVRAPTGEDYREEGAHAFSGLVWGQQLLGKVELVDYNGNLHLTLNVSTSPESINEQVLSQGWGRVAARPPPKLRKLVDALAAAEKDAKRNHYNIWEYGDVSDEEDNNPEMKGPIPERRPRFNK